MDIAPRILPFLVVATVLVVTPGPDFAVVTRNALRFGRRAGMFTAWGVTTGLAIWTAASVLGLSALLRVSAVAFETVKLAGAAYLLYLGGRTLLVAIGSRSAGTILDGESDGKRVVSRGEPGRAPRAAAAASYRQGLLCNVLNPKAAAIFTSIIPQFVVTGRLAEVQLAIFGLILVLLGVIWLSLYSVLAAGARTFMGRPRIRRAVDAVTGCVLVGFGLRLATEAG